MPATEAPISANADEPNYWPIGVSGARTVEVQVSDSSHVAITAFLRFGYMPEIPLQLMGIQLAPTKASEGLMPSELRDLPLHRWERAARAAAENALLAGAPHGQAVDPACEAEALIAERFPELNGDLRGNALRRRRSLVHLAQMMSEYRLAEQMGSRNPAQQVADKFGVTAATVRSWLHRARREGLASESHHPNAVTSRKK
ncbi:helix-turn-helix domain-containing protein [Kitasatospora sp. NPDC056327]|uniref:helix-turn-helix domain-containing protein n=1 Tax=Kitasatospora sp. NPDC056327 TaxID=3345785 RepID=UPI0035DA6F43